MKKYIVLISIIVIIVSAVVYFYYQKQIDSNAILYNNKNYTALNGKEITGTELATLIDKTINKNVQNNVEKDSKGIFKDNSKDSINIEIKFKQIDETIQEEKIEENDISKFIQYYSTVNFKCTNIEYHQNTNYVKYLYFEEE